MTFAELSEAVSHFSTIREFAVVYGVRRPSMNRSGQTQYVYQAIDDGAIVIRCDPFGSIVNVEPAETWMGHRSREKIAADMEILTARHSDECEFPSISLPSESIEYDSTQLRNYTDFVFAHGKPDSVTGPFPNDASIYPVFKCSDGVVKLRVLNGRILQPYESY